MQILGLNRTSEVNEPHQYRGLNKKFQMMKFNEIPNGFNKILLFENRNFTVCILLVRNGKT